MTRIASTLSLVTWLCMAWPGVAADLPPVVKLWPGKVPDETGNIGAEKFRLSPKLDRKQVEVTEPGPDGHQRHQTDDHDLSPGEG